MEGWKANSPSTSLRVTIHYLFIIEGRGAQQLILMERRALPVYDHILVIPSGGEGWPKVDKVAG